MKKGKKLMITAIVTAFYVAGIALAVRAATTVRTAEGAVAWSVSLATFPFVSVPAYLVLGRSRFEGTAEAFESRRDEFERILARIRQ
jgi:cardiolipin synthase